MIPGVRGIDRRRPGPAAPLMTTYRAPVGSIPDPVGPADVSPSCPNLFVDISPIDFIPPPKN